MLPKLAFYYGSVCRYLAAWEEVNGWLGHDNREGKGPLAGPSRLRTAPTLSNPPVAFYLIDC